MRALAFGTIAFVLASCAADPLSSALDSESLESLIDQQKNIRSQATSTRVELRHPRFFTLTDPDPETSCAGDVKTYLKTWETTVSESGTRSPAAYPASATDASRSIKPDFIKNIAVDITDASADHSSNEARSCAIYDQSSGTPPTSACAAFDYGALGGVRSTLSGSVLLFGGILGSNLAGHESTLDRGTTVSCGTNEGGAAPGSTSCSTGLLAVSVAPNATTASLEAAWAEIETESPAGTTPEANAGRSVAFSSDLQRIVFYGGSFANGTLADLWSYDLARQTWNTLQPSAAASSAMQTLTDVDRTPTKTGLPRASGPHALSGVVAVPNLALSGFSTSAVSLDPAKIDSTDRLMIVGGISANAGSTGVASGSYKFNPTFGPEYADRSSAPLSTVSAHDPIQWIESYHTQPLSNSLDPDRAAAWNAQVGVERGVDPTNAKSSLFRPLFSTTAPTGSFAYSFGAAPLLFTSGGVSAGSLAIAGGFNAATSSPGPAADINPAQTRALYFAARFNPVGAAVDRGAIDLSSNFSMLPNEYYGEWLSPVQWVPTSDVLRQFGGGHLLQGFDKSQNDIVFFGGTNCPDFMTNAGRTVCVFDNPSRYFRLTQNPMSGGTHVLGAAIAGSPPDVAGSAAARGKDSQGRVVMLSVGGMSQPAQNTEANPMWILYDNAGTPTWMQPTVLGSPNLPRLVSAAMVYSHVTHKFYLFGGYRPAGSARTVADTWEATIVGTNPATYQVRFRLLSGSVTCYPSCPAARRGHRLVEINYNNTTPTAEPDCRDPTAPCSFGLFMEGGTPDGVSTFGDRWMFDPTANNGNGHWQRVNGFPPRTLAAMTTVEYTVPHTQQRIRRAVMFGGETALHDPAAAALDPATSAATYHIAPTLGDTELFNFDTETWERAELLGKGYAAATAADRTKFANETAWRESFDATAPTPANLSVLTPPPLSGALMVTRTFRGPSRGASTPPVRLAIPEVFLFGGRRKDGTLLPFTETYKFCIGSTGEFRGNNPAQPTDPADCDAFDADDNPDSPSPSAAARGRWLLKTPEATLTSRASLTELHSFQGAAAYDSLRDRIVAFGGLDAAIDGSSEAHALDVNPVTTTHVLEYTPPSSGYAPYASSGTASERAAYHGEWKDIPACSFTNETTDNQPTARYGHSLTFDSLGDQLIVVGGYNATAASLGTPLTDSYGYPEVWSAKRLADASEAPSSLGTVAAFPCYYWQRVATPDPGSAGVIASGGLAHAAAVAVSASGYDTGYYSLLDQYCAKAGPVSSAAPEISKLLAGGISIDIDRSKLGPNENVLVHLKYLPLGRSNLRPDGERFTDAQGAVFRVHLLATGQKESEIRSVYQPRYFTYNDSEVFPRVVETLTHLGLPGSGVREEQIVVPVSMNSTIDRIRIERYSGSAILIEATVHRMGYR